MRIIPSSLVKALNKLGLSNYEASVYSALVMHEVAEAREIIDYLGISKPSVYEALDHLDEMGLAVKRVTKPAMYSAISPDIAISLLMDSHKRAADLALEDLKKLETAKIRTDKEDALWTIYGDTNIEYKIRNMFGMARKGIRCAIGERYVPIIRKCRMNKIPLRLLVFSDIPGLEDELKKNFPGKQVDIQVVPLDKIPPPPPIHAIDPSGENPLMNFRNFLELSVDDEELVMVPPFFSGTLSILNTRNKGAINQMNLMGEMMWRWLSEGGIPPFPMPEEPAHRREKQDNKKPDQK
jgi:HTH-type transcriptional regulator, sugar sensing transcriptional regulator